MAVTPSPSYLQSRKSKKALAEHGSGFFIDAARADEEGEGLHLRTYGKGLNEKDEDDEKADDIWNTIKGNWNPNEQYDPYAYVKYFVHLQYMIEHDEIFQKVLEKVKTYMHSCRLPFEKALDKSVNKEKTFIHEAFDSNDELYSTMKQDEIENND